MPRGSVKGKRAGRRSAYQEQIDATWLHDILAGKIKIKDVEPVDYVLTRTRIVEGVEQEYKEVIQRFKNGKDAIAYHILTGNYKFINKVLDKIVPTKTDVTSDGAKLPSGGYIIIPEKEKKYASAE